MRCARVLEEGATTCGECLIQSVPRAVERCIAAVDYRYPWDQLIARLKFRSEPGWAMALAEPMWRQAQAHGLPRPESLWIPIPVSGQRLAARGYNQSWELCRALEKLSSVPGVCNALVRTGEAPDQHSLPTSRRLTNLRGAFAVNPERIERLRHRHLILVDDVRTTGATLHNAALALRQAGCQSVDALVFARTMPSAERLSTA